MSQLFIVPTPIGNLADISLRALETLKSIDSIACENTSHTRKLLHHFDIHKSLIQYNQHSKENVILNIIQSLKEGKKIALVSDAGTPGISDPGSQLIRRVVKAGISVIPLPGASAFVIALSASGIDTHHFLFLGFLPHKKGRQTLFHRIAESEETIVLYESPHRILKTLQSLSETLGENRVVVLARELTKIHEEFLRGSASELLHELSSRKKVLGEFVVIVSGK